MRKKSRNEQSCLGDQFFYTIPGPNCISRPTLVLNINKTSPLIKYASGWQEESKNQKVTCFWSRYAYWTSGSCQLFSFCSMRGFCPHWADLRTPALFFGRSYWLAELSVRAVRKVTTGITGLWWPSVHSVSTSLFDPSMSALPLIEKQNPLAEGWVLTDRSVETALPSTTFRQVRKSSASC